MDADSHEARTSRGRMPGSIRPLRLESAQGVRMVLLIASGGAFDVTSLAKHLVDAAREAPPVAVPPVGEVAGNGTPVGTPVDRRSAWAPICELLAQRVCDRGVLIVGMASEAHAGGSAGCAQTGVGNLPTVTLLFDEPETTPAIRRDDRKARLPPIRGSRVRRRRESGHRKAERPVASARQSFSRRIGDTKGGEPGDLPAIVAKAIAGKGLDIATPSGISRANGAAHVDGAAQSSASKVSGPITVTIASGRPGLLNVLLPRLAREPDIKVVGDPAADTARLRRCLELQPPKLLLLDEPFLDRLGLQSLRMIRAMVPDVRVLLICDAVHPGLVDEVLRNHFHGFLLTGAPPDACVKAIRAVAQGELWLPRALLAEAISEPTHVANHDDPRAETGRSRADAKNTLTRREAQVVEHLRQGFSNKEIARRLGIMEDTVKKHLQSVFGKLGVHRRALVALGQVPGQSNIA